ncbi:MAG: 2-iminobutanoate/2-iminopropanoate deaminase [Solirubrobacteraceae bacterium]|jgi:2-iminobutanoate/2-iminopropanoate deaminase|nr:2-iminobutanoate/2-iminopropanoate deaminase [Solirubrobacteraceae bacterium]
MSHHRKTVTADGAPHAAGPYSHAVVSNGIVFCSGQVPTDPETGKLVEGSIGDRTRRCLDNLAVVAAAAGAQLSDAVRVGIYLTDIGTFKDVNEAYGAYFETDPPARSAIGVAALPLGADVEIDAFIALPD